MFKVFGYFGINDLHLSNKIPRVSKYVPIYVIFCSVSVKYEPISMVIEIIMSRNKHVTVRKMPTSPEIRASTTLGSKCQIE